MSARRRTLCCSGAEGGFSLIELMISLVLGLLVSAAAVGIFLSNQRTYRATESLARIQENARVAFELMAREVRQAAGNPCGMNLPVANVLNGASAATIPWWMNWDRGIVGYDNGALAGAAAGTDAIEFLSSGEGTVTVTRHDQQPRNPGSPASFKVDAPIQGLRAGDIVLVCDYTQASIVQVGAVRDGNTTIEFGRGNGQPGNCTKDLGVPVVCAANGSGKSYSANSLLARLHAVRWFVADNGRGGRSLYRVPVERGSVQPREEVAERIRDMQVTYLVAGAGRYTGAGAGVDWKNVIAVHISLTLQGVERGGAERSQLVRTLVHTVSLRNRTS
ncbi:prepilin-type N-terminal cleavage/methylation domain-containing protein [Lysobacter sp. S4-A87]|uniref:prepilin-type N-terminal cleavage/methylation domain-containing protein n=1 Tax=Lysobacter sp. S4-A87 TaxID=2925843 RepID=UPI001F52D247|nr:prepilin-type N-terminal cleavage/methylation domain-containing protein [Lysobacter sp. S4-A87]UNK49725.1 prepilin-type N-terminal cleavage/methylation domain-containing protein [Lysobacter sp. S4-A87]